MAIFRGKQTEKSGDMNTRLPNRSKPVSTRKAKKLARAVARHQKQYGLPAFA